MSFNCYITFPTTYYAIRAESILKKLSYPFKMVPVPRVISSSCGTALCCQCDDLKEIRDYLRQDTVELEKYYRIDETSLKINSVEELILDD
jgi:hypothetical protein